MLRCCWEGVTLEQTTKGSPTVEEVGCWRLMICPLFRHPPEATGETCSLLKSDWAHVSFSQDSPGTVTASIHGCVGAQAVFSPAPPP